MTLSNTIMLDVQNLNKRFGNVHAVKDLSFQINKGEVFGFLGPNGAGKTTTMRILTCFIPSTSGKVFINGKDIENFGFEIRKNIGYLPESAPLYPDMLVEDYLKFVGSLHGLRGNKLTSACNAMYKVCGLQKMQKREIGKLSKGFRQRVGLAQAMIHDPDLLILDEPLSGLDPNQIVEIRELIKHIGKEKTVIYCSHILSEVSATCSRILIINQGTVVATGTSDELISRSGKGNHYTLHVKGQLDTIELKIKQHIPEVSSVRVTPLSDELHKVFVTSSDSNDIGEALFSCAVANNWKLPELHREKTSLEEVFTQLTRG